MTLDGLLKAICFYNYSIPVSLYLYRTTRRIRPLNHKPFWDLLAKRISFSFMTILSWSGFSPFKGKRLKNSLMNMSIGSTWIKTISANVLFCQCRSLWKCVWRLQSIYQAVDWSLVSKFQTQDQEFCPVNWVNCGECVSKVSRWNFMQVNGGVPPINHQGAVRIWVHDVQAARGQNWRGRLRSKHHQIRRILKKTQIHQQSETVPRIIRASKNLKRCLCRFSLLHSYLHGRLGEGAELTRGY